MTEMFVITETILPLRHGVEPSRTLYDMTVYANHGDALLVLGSLNSVAVARWRSDSDMEAQRFSAEQARVRRINDARAAERERRDSRYPLPIPEEKWTAPLSMDDWLRTDKSAGILYYEVVPLTVISENDS